MNQTVQSKLGFDGYMGKKIFQTGDNRLFPSTLLTHDMHDLALSP